MFTSRSISSAENLGNPIGERNVFTRDPIHVPSLMIEDRFCYHDPFEYEYRCTEYKYDSPDESASETNVITSEND